MSFPIPSAEAAASAQPAESNFENFSFDFILIFLRACIKIHKECNTPKTQFCLYGEYYERIFDNRFRCA